MSSPGAFSEAGWGTTGRAPQVRAANRIEPRKPLALPATWPKANGTCRVGKRIIEIRWHWWKSNCFASLQADEPPPDQSDTDARVYAALQRGSARLRAKLVYPWQNRRN